MEQSLQEQGFNSAYGKILTWHNFIVDGHHRYEICQRLGIPFETEEVALETREEVLAFIAHTQLGRRNLAPEWFSYLRGKWCEAEQQVQGANLRSATTEATSESTGMETVSTPEKTPKSRTRQPKSTGPSAAQKIAKQTGGTERTVRADRQFAQDVDTVAAVTGLTPHAVTSKIASKKVVHKLAKAKPAATKKAMAAAKSAPTKRGATKKVEEVLDKECPRCGQAKPLVHGSGIRFQPYDRLCETCLDQVDAELARNLPPREVFDVLLVDPPTWADLASLDLPLADNALVLLWALPEDLPIAQACLSVWGAKYQTHMVFQLDPAEAVPGAWVIAKHRLLLFGLAGTLPAPRAPLKHSIIPRESTPGRNADLAYQIAEGVCPGRRYAELFNSPTTQNRPGWTRLGGP